MAAFAGTELAVTRAGAEVGAGTFDVVGAKVLVFGAAVVVVGAGAGAPDPACRSVESTVGPGDGVGPAAFDAGAPDPACRSVESTVGPGDGVGPAAFDAVVGTADGGVRTGVAELGAVEAGARGMGGASELGGAKGIGGASGLAVATGAVVGGLVDDDGFATAGEVTTTVAMGTEAIVTVERIELGGTEAESAGNLTAVCPGGTETTDSVTRGSVGTGAVGTGTVGATVLGNGVLGNGVLGNGAAATAIEGKGTGLVDGATVALTTGTAVETGGTPDGALLPTGKAVARGAVTMTGAASCPTPTRGTAGPAPAPARTTPPVEVLSTGAALGMPGPEARGAIDAPDCTGAMGAPAEAGAIGVVPGDTATPIGTPLAGGRSRA